MKLIREKAGVISEGPIWILFDFCWMYTGHTLLSLAMEIITNWRKDKNLIG